MRSASLLLMLLLAPGVMPRPARAQAAGARLLGLPWGSGPRTVLARARRAGFHLDAGRIRGKGIERLVLSGGRAEGLRWKTLRARFLHGRLFEAELDGSAKGCASTRKRLVARLTRRHGKPDPNYRHGRTTSWTLPDSTIELTAICDDDGGALELVFSGNALGHEAIALELKRGAAHEVATAPRRRHRDEDPTFMGIPWGASRKAVAAVLEKHGYRRAGGGAAGPGWVGGSFDGHRCQRIVPRFNLDHLDHVVARCGGRRGGSVGAARHYLSALRKAYGPANTESYDPDPPYRTGDGKELEAFRRVHADATWEWTFPRSSISLMLFGHVTFEDAVVVVYDCSAPACGR